MKKLIALLVLFASIFASDSASAQAPPTNVFGIDFTANNTQTVSGANHFRLRYNSATGLLEVSKSGAAYAGITGNWVFNGNNSDLVAAGVQGVCTGATATGCAIGNSAHTTSFNSSLLSAAAGTRFFTALTGAGLIALSLEGDVTDDPASAAVAIRGDEAMTTGSILNLYENFDTLHAQFKPASNEGIQITDASGGQNLTLSLNLGSFLCYGSSCWTAAAGLTATSAAADGALLMQIVSSVGQTAAGGAAMRVDMDASGVNNPTYGVTSAPGVFCDVGLLLNVSGTVLAGDVVVWTAGTANTVTKAAATNNLTTIAGVATVGQTGGTEYICTHGRTLVNAQAGITTGQTVGTAAAGAGTVQSGTTPPNGAIVGRALENTGATTASKVTLSLNL